MLLAEEDKTDRLAVSLGLPLGLEAPVMTLNSVIFLLFLRLAANKPWKGIQSRMTVPS